MNKAWLSIKVNVCTLINVDSRSIKEKEMWLASPSSHSGTTREISGVGEKWRARIMRGPLGDPLNSV